MSAARDLSPLAGEAFAVWARLSAIEDSLAGGFRALVASIRSAPDGEKPRLKRDLAKVNRRLQELWPRLDAARTAYMQASTEVQP